MGLYDKKFTTYENCMISFFGQPGKLKGSNKYCKVEFQILTNKLNCKVEF